MLRRLRSGVPLGSPPYMAPEQAAGKRHDIGPAADVYALGATLYEIVTGRPPFQGESYLETLGHVLADDPIPPRVLRPGLPRDLETICLRCLEKDPARRYESALALRGTWIATCAVSRYRPDRSRCECAWQSGSVAGRCTLPPWSFPHRSPRSWSAESCIATCSSRTTHGRWSVRSTGPTPMRGWLVRHLQAFQLRQAGEALDAHHVERAQDILSAIQADRAASDVIQDPGDPGFTWHYLMRLARGTWSCSPIARQNELRAWPCRATPGPWPPATSMGRSGCAIRRRAECG